MCWELYSRPDVEKRRGQRFPDAPSRFTCYVLKVFEQGSFYGEKTARTEEDCGLTSKGRMVAVLLLPQ